MSTHEVGDALVLGHVGVGAGQQQAEGGLVGHARPHLLAVHDPLVAVADGGGGQAGEGRTRPPARRTAGTTRSSPGDDRREQPSLGRPPTLHWRMVGAASGRPEPAGHGGAPAGGPAPPRRLGPRARRGPVRRAPGRVGRATHPAWPRRRTKAGLSSDSASTANRSLSPLRMASPQPRGRCSSRKRCSSSSTVNATSASWQDQARAAELGPPRPLRGSPP